MVKTHMSEHGRHIIVKEGAETGNGAQPTDQADVPRTFSGLRIYERPERHRPPQTRQSMIHRFVISGFKGYLIVGLFEDGQPCEIFLKLAKTGSTLAGFADAWSTAISIMIQHGIPLEQALSKHVGSRFEPMGLVEGPEGEQASSIVDYVARWILDRYVPEETP